MARTGRPRRIPEPEAPPPDCPVDPLPDGDQLRMALIDGARVLARSTLAAMPALGRLAIERMLRRPSGRAAVIVHLKTGLAELVAAADGEKPLRAVLR